MAGPEVPEQPTTLREVTLYFPAPGYDLVPESRELALPDIETFAVESLVEELFRGMNERWPGGFIPRGSSIRASFIVGDTAIVDIDAPAMTEGWATGARAEILTLQSIVHTVVENFEKIERVQILVNGGEVATLAGHIDLTKPLRPDSSIVRR
ncbi:MAG: GerMN domain-containing protein [Thermoanaerobaculia bacterium]|nr:GerMN domain-containing protein [Thermoanaerobaculia bacterium]